MDIENILTQLLITVAPAIIVALIAYYFFNGFIKNEDGRRRFLLQKDAQADSLPIRLQAYERLTLFLERIKPNQLLIRVKPNSEDKAQYEQLLIGTIDQEFEHNLSQQIYMSDEVWNVITSAKNGTIKLLRHTALREDINSAQAMRETILAEMINHTAPSSVALEYLKREVKEAIG